ncbi:MAG: hypothetical protein IT381_19250 [Deltaproteobacteria bacterium]|nr:hypothetical protein [Deltaproteobacteria bacterium]
MATPVSKLSPNFPTAINYKDKKDSVLLANRGALGKAWSAGLTPPTPSVFRFPVPNAHDVVKKGLDARGLADAAGLSSEDARALLLRMQYNGYGADITAAEMAELVTSFAQALSELEEEIPIAYDAAEISDWERDRLAVVVNYLRAVAAGLAAMNGVFANGKVEVVYLQK